MLSRQEEQKTHSCHVSCSDDPFDKKTRSHTLVSLHARPDEACEEKIVASTLIQLHACLDEAFDEKTVGICFSSITWPS